ncbi:hypothetical protein AOQ84DRAFT_356907 [Glonium stellatum]|uniref:Uncharacterized protein n=1 Tax=Glonium stellatum TaxID=574774 RepID=A0A8E2ER96_9PEZI|nr:hypothetical protein AOQ84DRAFT_356907 [Glonium stellatum]
MFRYVQRLSRRTCRKKVARPGVGFSARCNRCSIAAYVVPYGLISASAAGLCEDPSPVQGGPGKDSASLDCFRSSIRTATDDDLVQTVAAPNPSSRVKHVAPVASLTCSEVLVLRG